MMYRRLPSSMMIRIESVITCVVCGATIRPLPVTGKLNSLPMATAPELVTRQKAVGAGRITPVAKLLSACKAASVPVIAAVVPPMVARIAFAAPAMVPGVSISQEW
jgi:hypothetical protein